MSFESEFKMESQNAIKAAEETVKVTAFDAFNTAVIISPVANKELWINPPKGPVVGGRFRSNWNLSFSSFDDSTTDSVVSQQQKLGELNQIFTAQYSGNYIYSNNLPYAVPLDEGHSSQAPTGITDVVAMRIKARIPEIARAANRKYKVS